MPPTTWKKCPFPFHILARTLKTFFAKQFTSVLEEKKAGKTVSPIGKAVERDISLWIVFPYRVRPCCLSTQKAEESSRWIWVLSSAPASDPNDFWSPKAKYKYERVKEADLLPCPLLFFLLSNGRISSRIPLMLPTLQNRPSHSLQQHRPLASLSIFP